MRSGAGTGDTGGSTGIKSVSLMSFCVDEGLFGMMMKTGVMKRNGKKGCGDEQAL